ncbi:PREDICTED: uncharacterized protein LOC104595839 isoform X2 [Nelumbo nucifera]|nr:PREDICTED: uncharacterized protein LOC104595839 isoform X2 [Nelumbo nucifera]
MARVTTEVVVQNHGMSASHPNKEKPGTLMARARTKVIAQIYESASDSHPRKEKKGDVIARSTKKGIDRALRKSYSHPKMDKCGKAMAKSTMKAVVSSKGNGGSGKPRKKSNYGIERQPRSEAIEAASSYKTEFPHFAALCGKSRRSHMVVPKAVARKVGITGKGKAVLLDPKGRSWRVSFAPRTDGRVDIISGWAAFWKANNIVEGEACHFEFIQGTVAGKVIICVNIFRAAGFGELARFSNIIPMAFFGL